MSTIRVLARPAFANRADNPYNYVLYTKLAERGVRVEEYSLLRAAFGRYEICHVHWPEIVFNTSRSRAKARLRARLFLEACDALRRRGTKLVWTVHNLRSHEQRHPEAEERFWHEFVPKLDAVITLSNSGLGAVRERFPRIAELPAFVVPHQHYRGEYESDVTREAARARLGIPDAARVILFFGRVGEYKNVPALARALRDVPENVAGGPVRLLVAGKPRNAAIESTVRQACAGDPRISLHLGAVPRAEAQLYFRAADLVALPYREILNSGTALLALSFDRPVLVPALGACRDLAEQVGGDWVFTYDQLTPEILAGALERAVTSARAASCPLDMLSPASVADRTLAAYRALLSR